MEYELHLVLAVAGIMLLIFLVYAIRHSITALRRWLNHVKLRSGNPVKQVEAIDKLLSIGLKRREEYRFMLNVDQDEMLFIFLHWHILDEHVMVEPTHWAFPLHFAVIRGHNTALKLFTAKGANVNTLDEHNKTPLDYANNEETINLLRSFGAKTAEELKKPGSMLQG